MRLSKQCYWFVLYVKVPQPLSFTHRDGLPQKRSQKWVDSDFTRSISLVFFLYGSTSVISIWILSLVPNMTLKVQPQLYDISMPSMLSAPVSTSCYSLSVGWKWGQQCLYLFNNWNRGKKNIINNLFIHFSGTFYNNIHLVLCKFWVCTQEDINGYGKALAELSRLAYCHEGFVNK